MKAGKLNIETPKDAPIPKSFKVQLNQRKTHPATLSTMKFLARFNWFRSYAMDVSKKLRRLHEANETLVIDFDH